MVMFTEHDARELLRAAQLFFDVDEDDDPGFEQMVNLSDTFAWACADGEKVADEELPQVAELFWRYGWCGILYWVNEKRGGGRAEFADVNRFIDFVREEERIRQEQPESTKRAYLKREYVIGRDSG